MKTPSIPAVIRFVRKRERMMKFYGALSTRERWDACARIRRVCAHYRQADQAKVIGMILPDLRYIAAGRSSRYYEAEQAFLAQLESALMSDRGPEGSLGLRPSGSRFFSELENSPL